jgi:hypothetical protein
MRRRQDGKNAKIYDANKAEVSFVGLSKSRFGFDGWAWERRKFESN